MKRITIDTLVAMVLAALLCFAVAGQAKAQSGDPSGFTDILNKQRSIRGLSPVAYDPGSAAIAAKNNQYQQSYGLGHFVTGGYGQCAGAGQSDVASVTYAWLASAGHAAMLLDPYLRSVGYHQLGAYHTVSCLRDVTYQKAWGYKSVLIKGH